MSIVSYDAVFGALTQQNVPPLPEESSRLDSLPNDPIINVLSFLPDADVLQLLRACPNDPELQEVREASSRREYMRNSVLPELVNFTRSRNGLEKLKAAARRGDLLEGALSGIMGGIAGPRLLGIATGIGAMSVIDEMLMEGERYSIMGASLLTLGNGAEVITPRSLIHTVGQFLLMSMMEINVRLLAELSVQILPILDRQKIKMCLRAAFTLYLIALQGYAVGHVNGGIGAFLRTSVGRLTVMRTLVTASLAANALFQGRSRSVQELLSMAVAGAAARLISNCIVESWDTVNREDFGPILAAALSTLAGILTIK